MGTTFEHRAPGVDTDDFFNGVINQGWGTVIAAAATLRVAYLAVQTKDGVAGAACPIHWCPRDEMCNFGYKIVSEDMGPGDARCPARILDLLSPLEDLYCGHSLEHARSWREASRRHLERLEAASKVRAGDLIRFARELEFVDGSRGSEFVFERGSDFHWPHGYGRLRISDWRSGSWEIVARASR